MVRKLKWVDANRFFATFVSSKSRSLKERIVEKPSVRLSVLPVALSPFWLPLMLNSIAIYVPKIIKKVWMNFKMRGSGFLELLALPVVLFSSLNSVPSLAKSASDTHNHKSAVSVRNVFESLNGDDKPTNKIN